MKCSLGCSAVLAFVRRVQRIMIDQTVSNKGGVARQTEQQATIPSWPHPTRRRPPLLNGGRVIRMGPEAVDLTIE